MFVVCDVVVMNMTLTSLDVWLLDVGWQDKGLISLPALMSVLHGDDRVTMRLNRELPWKPP